MPTDAGAASLSVQPRCSGCLSTANSHVYRVHGIARKSPSSGPRMRKGEPVGSLAHERRVPARLRTAAGMISIAVSGARGATSLTERGGADCDMVVRPFRTMKTVAVVRQRKCEQRHFATGRGDGLAQPPEPQTRRCCDRIEHPCPITQCAQAVSGSGNGRPMSTRAMTLCGGVRFRLASRYAAISLPAVRPPPDRMPRGFVFVLSRARVW